MVPMFKKVPFLGTLFLEKTLYFRTSPEIFVCIDERGGRYLCALTNMPDRFLVGRINRQHLLQVLKDKRPLYEAIRRCSVKGIVTGLAGRYSFTADTPDTVWPVCDRLLGLWDFDAGVQEYCERLESQ